MGGAIDLPIRAGAVPRMDHEPEPAAFLWPSFGYWVKAGIAFTLGASTVGFALVCLSWVLTLGALGAFIGLLGR